MAQFRRGSLACNQKHSFTYDLQNGYCRPQPRNFIKKETLAQAFSYAFCEISKRTFFLITPTVDASVQLFQIGTNSKAFLIDFCHCCFQNSFYAEQLPFRVILASYLSDYNPGHNILELFLII